ncbi:hypothetical protein M405DRAFT_157910 [Rhizopogon salebrosus TDB-379]|jgi:hypothetical protein|nr:hypothetical protein M405DRAFT_157910 [Rhizopogon salebrosus TDB-379]
MTLYERISLHLLPLRNHAIIGLHLWTYIHTVSPTVLQVFDSTPAQTAIIFSPLLCFIDMVMLGYSVSNHCTFVFAALSPVGLA